MGRRCYVLLRRRHNVPIRCCRGVPLRRQGHVPMRRRPGDVPPRRRWVFHLRDVPATLLACPERLRCDDPTTSCRQVGKGYLSVFSSQQVIFFSVFLANSFMIK